MLKSGQRVVVRFYSSLTIGAFHTNYCEDFLVVAELGSQQQLVAIMDGCSMGTESTFASLLIGKLLRKIAKEFFYQEFVQSEIGDLKAQLKNA